MNSSRSELIAHCAAFDDGERRRDAVRCQQALDAVSAVAEKSADAAWTVCEAVMHDRQREPTRAKVALGRLGDRNDYDWPSIKALVGLSHKINMHERCIQWVDSFVSKSEGGPALLVDLLIKKAYSLEQMGRFEEAIEHFEYLLQRHVHELTSGALLAEVYHGLGHCHTELGIRDSICYHLREGRRLMASAVSQAPRYFSCLGTIHSEARDYKTAIRILQFARSHAPIRSDKHLLGEIIFYLGDAMSWSSMDAEAEELFDQFRKYAERHDNTDALCHCNYYDAILNLRTRSVRDLERGEILRLKSRLREHAPSEYMPTSFRSAWQQMKAILEFLLSIRELYNKPRDFLRGKNKLLQMAEQAREADVTGQVGLLRVSGSGGVRPIEFVQFKNLADPEIGCDLSVLDELDRLPVVIADGTSRGLVVELSYARRGVDTVVFEHRQDGDGPVQCEFSAERIVTRGEREVIYSLGAVLALLDQVRQRVAQPVFLFGMVPTIEAPTFGIRAGRIEFPIEEL
jgi:tetratricopeptide (TPR) repeat protein